MCRLQISDVQIGDKELFIGRMNPEEVNDRLSFIRFVESLRSDLETNQPYWGNINLSDFLDALGNYTEDVQGYYDNAYKQADADVPSWRLFADILKGASMYEQQ